MSNPIQIRDTDGVTLVTLDDGKANTLGGDMISALSETAEKLARGRGPVILTGAGRFFSAGLDLGGVVALDRDALATFLDRFEKMAVSWFSLARPVIAAVNGHAIAGGAILALVCDFRVAAQGEWKIGLTEVPLGIPFPASALELSRLNVNPSHAARVFLAGELFTPADAVAAGLLDRVVPADQLIPTATAFASQLAKSPGIAFSQTKSALREPTLQRYEAVRGRQAKAFLEGLFDPAVRAHLQATLDAMKTKKK